MNNMIKTITYSDKDRMPVQPSALIIRVDSINEKYGKLIEFVFHYKLFEGMTNGKIFMLGETTLMPTTRLKNIIDEVLKPLGMHYEDDFVLTYNNPLYDEKGKLNLYVNTPLPECVVTEWLGSIISMEGNFVWHIKVPKKEKVVYNFTLEELQKMLIKYLTKTNPDKLDFNPRVIEIHEDRVVFGMRKHYGRLYMSIGKLLE